MVHVALVSCARERWPDKRGCCGMVVTCVACGSAGVSSVAVMEGGGGEGRRDERTSWSVI